MSRALLILAAIALTMGACAESGAPADSTGTTESQEVVAARAQVLDDLGRGVIVPGYLRLAESAAVLASDLERPMTSRRAVPVRPLTWINSASRGSPASMAG